MIVGYTVISLSLFLPFHLTLAGEIDYYRLDHPDKLLGEITSLLADNIIVHQTDKAIKEDILLGLTINLYQ